MHPTVFREGAENRARGGRSLISISEFGVTPEQGPETEERTLPYGRPEGVTASAAAKQLHQSQTIARCRNGAGTGQFSRRGRPHPPSSLGTPARWLDVAHQLGRLSTGLDVTGRPEVSPFPRDGLSWDEALNRAYGPEANMPTEGG